MKKIPKLLLTIVLLAGPVQPTFAAIEEKGTTWWSVEELLSFNQKVEAEKDAECGNNEGCRREFGFTMIEKGPEYSALNNLLEGQIWLTSINPGEETVKVFYFGDDMMLKRMGIEEKISLEHLYLGWVEDWHGQIFNYDRDYFSSGSLLGNHPMYTGGIAKNGKGWLPDGEEVELSVSGSDLVNNTHGLIDYAVYTERNVFNAQGYFDYSNCLKSSDYEVGMECKMYVSGDQWVSYFPVTKQNESIPENEPTSDDQGEDAVVETSPNGQSENTIDIDQEKHQTEETGIQNEVATEPESEEPKPDTTLSLQKYSQEGIKFEQEAGISLASSNSVPTSIQKENNLKAPETGNNTKKASGGSIEMPWWMIAINVVGLLSLLWLLLPTKKPKSQKKPRKTIDKNTGLR